MLRSVLAALAALVLVSVTLIPDDAYARRGGGGGFRGGGGGDFTEAGIVAAACMPDALLAPPIR